MRTTLTFTIVLLAASCVPTEEDSAAKGATPQAEPAPGPALAPSAAEAQRKLRTPRLDPNRPRMAGPSAPGDPSARPRAGGEGGLHASTDAQPATPSRLAPVAKAFAAKAGAPPTAPAAPAPAAPASPAAPAAPAAAATPAAPGSPITAVYYDAFERAELGPEWNATSPNWRVQGGQLCGRGARNHPVWLGRKLPVNARIEFDAVSTSPEGDLKVELWGDGKSFAKAASYNDATSYIAIFGGWKNQYHVLARQDEHAAQRPEVKVDPSGGDVRARPVKQGQRYHFKIERADGKTVRWLVDDIEVISFTDPAPLKGAGHEHLGFNDWEAPVCFDNLQITPLPGG